MNDDALERLAPLADRVRRALYSFVVAQAQPVDRDSAAAGTGIGRALAAFHLDRLVAAGLLSAEYHRRSGRTGPGAGRPAKFYARRAGNEVAVSLPQRDYDEVAEILAEAVEASDTAEAAALDAARRRGRQVADEARAASDAPALVDTLATRGYEPFVDSAGVVRLRNCPFDRLANDHRSLTCSLNLAMLSALGEELEPGRMEATPQRPDESCCVAFVPRPA